MHSQGNNTFFSYITTVKLQNVRNVTWSGERDLLQKLTKISHRNVSTFTIVENNLWEKAWALSGGFWRMDSRIAVSTSPMYLLVKCILNPIPPPNTLFIQKLYYLGSEICLIIKPSKWFWYIIKFEYHRSASYKLLNYLCKGMSALNWKKKKKSYWPVCPSCQLKKHSQETQKLLIFLLC